MLIALRENSKLKRDKGGGGGGMIDRAIIPYQGHGVMGRRQRRAIVVFQKHHENSIVLSHYIIESCR